MLPILVFFMRLTFIPSFQSSHGKMRDNGPRNLIGVQIKIMARQQEEAKREGKPKQTKGDIPLGLVVVGRPG